MQTGPTYVSDDWMAVGPPYGDLQGLVVAGSDLFSGIGINLENNRPEMLLLRAGLKKTRHWQCYISRAGINRYCDSCPVCDAF
jgi:hypothetical protein